MFLQNKYTKWYMNIITQAKLDVNNRSEGYFEKHHIIPKSLDGSDSKDNLVKLTAREHFICHTLLIKMLEGKARQKMAYAMYFLMNRKNRKEQLKINSRIFLFLREEHSKAISMALTGLERSEEHCKNLSLVAKKRVDSGTWNNPWAGEKGSEMSSRQNKERVLKGTNPWAGKKGSELSKKICAEQIKKGTHPFQDREKARERTLKQVENGTHMTQVEHTCPHCGKTGTGWTMFRWHFKNCKTLK